MNAGCVGSISSHDRLTCLTVCALTLLAAACTTDQGGYGFTAINQSAEDVVIWLDSNDPAITRLPAHTRGGIAFGWTYGNGWTLTVMDDSCAVIGSAPAMGAATVLTIAAGRTLKTDPDRRVFDDSSERLVSGVSDRTCRPLRVSNRTTQDVVFRFGDDFKNRVFVPACGEVALDPAHVDDLPPPPTDAAEVRYAFVPGQAMLTPTFTITSEQVLTGAFPSPPPCQGLAPTPSSS